MHKGQIIQHLPVTKMHSHHFKLIMTAKQTGEVAKTKWQAAGQVAFGCSNAMPACMSNWTDYNGKVHRFAEVYQESAFVSTKHYLGSET